MKICTKCKQEKPLDEYKKHGDGLHPRCKVCTRVGNKKWYWANRAKSIAQKKEYYKAHCQDEKWLMRQSTFKKKYRDTNRDVLNAKNREYYQRNKDKVNQRTKKYKKDNIDKFREYQAKYCRNKRKTDICYKLNARMSGLIRHGLKSGKAGRKAGRSWLSMVSYNVTQLKQHLEKQFTEGMTWEKFMNREIHIDHIIPRSFFVFKDERDVEFKMCWRLENLQPLWGNENQIKSCKLKIAG